MPYRHAHWWVLALFPLIAVAFWPNYWSRMTTAPFALHAHGITASLWLVLVAAQSWSIQRRRNALHRQLGLAIFMVVPAFAAGGALALQGLAGMFAGQVTPFHAAFGARLTVADAVAAPVLVGLVAYALIRRRQVRVHAAAILATVILVLPPILGRLVAYVPGIGGLAGATGIHPFVYGFHGGMLVSVAIALWLANRDGAARGPFMTVAAAGIVQMIGFETLGRAGFWEDLMGPIAAMPPAALAVPAAAITALVLWWAWRQVPARTVPVGAGGPVTA